MKRKIWMVVVVISATALAASGGEAPTTAGPSKDRPTLRLVTYSSFVLDPEVERQVEVRLGVELEVSASGDAGEALARAILNAGSPEGDVFFGLDNTLMSKALAGDVFVDPDGVELPAWSRPDDASPTVAINWGAVCVDYDRGWFDERALEPPATISDLIDPQYRDLLVMPSPASSSPGLVFLSAVHSSIDEPVAFWEALKSNGVEVVGSWDDAWFERYTVNGGDRPLVISYASSPPAEVYFSEGAITEPSTGVAEGTCARQTEFAAVLRGTEQPDLAARLVLEMTGETWQNSLPLTNFVEPLRPGSVRPDLFERFAPIPTTMIELDPALVGSKRDDWVTAWRNVME